MFFAVDCRQIAGVKASVFNLVDDLLRRLALLTLCLLMLVVIDFAYDGRRLVQMLILVLPGLFLLTLKLSEPWMLRLRMIFVGLWFGAFVFDSAMRVFLDALYQAQPDSSLVLTAIANTTLREAVEYLQMYSRLFAVVLVVGIPVGFTLFVLIRYLSQPRVGSQLGSELGYQRSKAVKGLILLVLILCTLAYASKPWRRLHPFLYWPQWAIALTDLRTSWTQLDANRNDDLRRAQMLPLTISGDDSTVVLVISESLNRDNMSTHGYPRATTPNLAQIQQSHEGNLINFHNAWSTKANTLASLDSFFYFDAAPAQAADATPIHLIAMARAAGYHVTWISNHDDNGIEQKHARLANEVVLLNRAPGRSSYSPDSLAIPPFRAALAQTHARKLIVLHLMGAHPHYRLRYPNTQNVFKEANDEVRHQMQAQGRSSTILARRNEYDAAIYHHDTMIADTFMLTQQMTSNLRRAAWVFVSDHGQEVGHVKNHAGHSFTTPAGFRIPAFIWQNQPFTQDHRDLGERVFRLDWMAWTLASVMGIDWTNRDSHRDILSADYHFSPPDLGIAIASFKE
jgi:heptose-I-phosphate ethanolaminephosphotransferase